ncbi:MAG: hypothetical protein SVK08_11525 [Halobacteriota archaeon]|nr:hypothetical protein [Halobacteriota archaeon]
MNKRQLEYCEYHAVSVCAPLFVITIATVFMIISEKALALLNVTVYIIIPVSSVVFIILFNRFLIKTHEEGIGSEGEVSFNKLDVKLDKKPARDLLSKRVVDPAVISIFIVYLAYIIFVTMILVIILKFLPSIMQEEELFFDISPVKEVLFHAVIIQGFFSGLVAGQFKEGKISAGLKHSVIMVLISVGAFVTLGLF